VGYAKARSLRDHYPIIVLHWVPAAALCGFAPLLFVLALIPSLESYSRQRERRFCGYLPLFY
jgi:hypothetical protein